MKKTARDDLAHAVALVERRLELRRARLDRQAAELRDATRERVKPLPLLAVVAVAIVGFVIGRRPAARAQPASRGAGAKSGFLAALIATVPAVLRIASNPLVRSAWQAHARRRV